MDRVDLTGTRGTAIYLVHYSHSWPRSAYSPTLQNHMTKYNFKPNFLQLGIGIGMILYKVIFDYLWPMLFP
jgi:hypothetical protein